MAKSKKPRKQHKARQVSMLPIVFALPKEKKNELQLTPHMCVEAFRLGHGCEDHACTLANQINIGAVLSKGQPDRIRAQIAAGLEAVRLVMVRGQSGK